MSSTNANPRPARHWRDLQQGVAAKSMSREGKKRSRQAVLRWVLWGAVLGIVGWGGYEVWRTMQGAPDALISTKQSNPLREISLQTNGVMDLARVKAILAIPEHTELAALDLPALRSALTSGGQVKTAVVTREFPDKLTVTIAERTPVLRVVVRGESGKPVVLLVARDGTVYPGYGYDPALLASLPYLDGVRLVRDQTGYQPVQGMDAVADLLGAALSGTPELYRSFQVVSLLRFAGDGEIVVRTAQVESVTFGIREDFYRQLSKLDLILDEMYRPAGAAPIKAINLAVGGRQVPVSFSDFTPPPTSSSTQSGPSFFRPNHTAPAAHNRDF